MGSPIELLHGDVSQLFTVTASYWLRSFHLYNKPAVALWNSIFSLYLWRGAKPSLLHTAQEAISELLWSFQLGKQFDLVCMLLKI